VNDAGAVTVWGTGTPRRELLHVDDLADACLFLMERYDGYEFVNIGVGRCAPQAEALAVEGVVSAGLSETGSKRAWFRSASRLGGPP